MASLCYKSLISELKAQGFRYPEVDDLGAGLPVRFGDKDVGRLEIAMDDSLLVRMLNSAADVYEELEAFLGREPARVAVIREIETFHELHREIQIARFCLSGLEYFRYSRVVHQCERLPLSLEPRSNLARLKSPANYLERDVAAHRARVHRLVHDAHSAFAENADDAVLSDPLGRFVSRADQVLLLFGQHDGTRTASQSR